MTEPREPSTAGPGPARVIGAVERPHAVYAVVGLCQMFLGGLLCFFLMVMLALRLIEHPVTDIGGLLGDVAGFLVLFLLLGALPVASGVCTLVLRNRLIAAWEQQERFGRSSG